MNIRSCIAHALYKDLDIIEALPQVRELPVEKLEECIENYINSVQSTMQRVISEDILDKHVRAKDAAGLCATCLEAGVQMPPKMLLKVCQTIVQLQSLDAMHVMNTVEGEGLYFMKMKVDVGDLIGA